jgi:hypothetical protein
MSYASSGAVSLSPVIVTFFDAIDDAGVAA